MCISSTPRCNGEDILLLPNGEDHLEQRGVVKTACAGPQRHGEDSLFGS